MEYKRDALNNLGYGLLMARGGHACNDEILDVSNTYEDVTWAVPRPATPPLRPPRSPNVLALTLRILPSCTRSLSDIILQRMAGPSIVVSTAEARGELLAVLASAGFVRSP